MAKYLDENGLSHAWLLIKTYITGAVPTKTSDLTNDSGFVTAEDIPEGSVPSSTLPLMDGTATIGSETTFARGDHRHPSDSGKVSTTRRVNGYTLNEDISIKATDVPYATNVSVKAKIDAVEAAKADASALSSYAPLASPTFTGFPQTPTPSTGALSTMIANVAYVNQAINSAVTGTASYRGSLDAESEIPERVVAGWYWVVSTAGEYLGQDCEVGDMIFCNNTKDYGWVDSDFDIVQSNIETITNAEINSIIV